MSDLLNEASLVLIPSGIKASKVYAQIPEDGSGDMTFARASADSTRINSQGFVEVVPYNLITYSQTFSLWDKVQVGNTITVTDNFTTAPDGTTTAAKVVFATFDGTGQIFKSYDFGSTQNATATLYAKVPSGTKQAWFGFYDGSIKTQLKTLTTEWQRIEYSGSITAAGIRACWFYGEGGASNVEVHLWGGQLNLGATAKTYYATTDRLNIPRLNYQNGGGGCPSLLLEAQRTNALTYSEQFDNAIWTKQGGATITANTAISPDGYQDADTLTIAPSQYLHQGASLSSGQSYTISVYLKVASGTKQFKFNTFGSGNDFTSGAYTATTDWQRFSYTFTAVATGTTNIYPVIVDGLSSASFYIWGAQLEVGSYPSSYIPTLGTSVTRVADYYSRSLTSIASGTAYINIIDNVAQGNPGTHVYGPFSIVSSSLGLYLAKPNNQRLRLWTAAANSVFSTTVSNLKLAFTWDGTYVNVWQNGVQVVTNYSYAITNVNSMFSSTNIETTNSIGQITLFDSILTNAQLAELTA